MIYVFSYSIVLADDEYTTNIYTSATLLYWCTYNQVPTSKGDIAKVTTINYADSRLTIDLDDWLELFSYEINGYVMTIIKKSEVITDRKFRSTLISKSSTNCNSIKRGD